MTMRFEAIKARYGDCLLLTFGPPAQPIRLLVDGGPAGVFSTFLAKRLAKEPGGAPLTLNAVMVSHIDEDHVLGLLDLFGAIQDADKKHAVRPYLPKWLLHNSFDALAAEGEGGFDRQVGKDTVLADFDKRPDIDGVTHDVSRHVLASYGQGSRLATLAAALGVERNPPDRSVLMLENPPRKLVLGPATLTVVGPLDDEVARLRKEWLAWKAGKKSTAALAEYLDDSISNLSSIVVVVEAGGNTALLTGDARGDKVITGLERAGYLQAGGQMHVDVLKLPHHGSARNLEVGFFDRIHADHYVVSGDGTYGNPDKETIEMIAQARRGDQFTLHMTYDAASCDATHKSWREAREKVYDPALHAISPVVEQMRQGGLVTVLEGAVDIPLG